MDRWLPPAANSQSLRVAAMSELPTNEILQRLDQHHEHLLSELDDLDQRLESTLANIAKPASNAEPQSE